MSDYLQNLVTRSLNLTRVVQPRLASLFEPPVAGGPLSVTTSFDIARADAESQAAEAIRASDSSNAAPPAPAQRASVTHVPALTAQTFAEQHSNAPPQISSSNDPSALMATKQISPDVAPSAHPFSQAAASALREAKPESVQTTNAADASTLEDKRRRVADFEADGVEPERRELLVSLEPLDVAALRGRSHVVEPQLAPASPVAANASRPYAGSPTPTPDAPTTIHVTIGRIDVRAVVSNAPKESRPAHARTRPPLTLEDYLRQRKGGAR